ncbi:MAG: tail fiber domain-containing protein [Cyclobacteriaceae bacterium]
MKSKLHYGILLIIAALLITPVLSNAQTVGKPDGNTLNFFSTNIFGKLLGHREAGNFGFFNTTDQWIGIGQPTVNPFSTTKVPAYGLRNQWEGQTGIFALKNSPFSFGNTKDLAIEWGADFSSRVRFSFIRDLTDPTSLTEVMTLTPFPSVGINNTSPFANLDVIGTPQFRSATAIRGSFSGSLPFVTAISGELNNISSFGGTAVLGSAFGETEFLYGGNFQATNSSKSSTSTTYGVFAQASGNNSNTWAGYFSGDVYISGALTVASDRKFKENVSELDKREVVSKLMKLTPSSYNYKSDENMIFTQGMQYGFIAQDVEKIFPDLVRDVRQPVYRGKDELGRPQMVEGEAIEFKSINYLGMVPILTKAIQEHEATISTYETTFNAYEAKLQALEKQNEELTNNFAKLLTAIETNRADLLKDIVEASETSLGQNEPNPFGQSSKISYTLAKSVKNATIRIYNLDGKMMGDYQLDSSTNELEIKANTYEPGVYIYALIADGKTIGTRRMIVSK